MYTETLPEYRPRRALRKMEPDPDCAVCKAPANLGCTCEGRWLDRWVDEAETRTMQSAYEEIRSWVKEHAKEYILAYFHLLKEQRMQAHREHLEQLTNFAYQNYNLPPNPQDIQAANTRLKRGIDEDWQSSVHRYPEVLDYYFSLMRIELPNDEDSKVCDPPLSAMSRARKATQQQRLSAPPTVAGSAGGGGGGGGVEMGMTFVPSVRGRTPPPPVSERMTEKNIERIERERRRTPGPPPSHYQGMPRRHSSYRRHHPPQPPGPYPF